LFFIFQFPKHLCQVLASSVFLAEDLSTAQCFCFAVAVVLILIHSLLGAYKGQFEEGWAAGMAAFWTDITRSKPIASKNMYGEVHLQEEGTKSRTSWRARIGRRIPLSRRVRVRRLLTNK
jgi:hypothetical protein